MLMKPFEGYMRGMGLGGWLGNFKRIQIMPEEWRQILTLGDFEHFEKYITAEDVKRIAGFGMDHMRLCFDQILFEEYDKPFHYREPSFGYIDRFLEWAGKEGLNVVLNLHRAVGNYFGFSKEENYLTTNQEALDRFVSLWLEFEKHYHNTDVVFELINEVTDETNDNWNKLAARTIKELRQKNLARKIIIIGGGQWNSVDCLKGLQIFDDENVIYTFHFYSLHEFTHQRGILQRDPMILNREMAYPGSMEPYREDRRYLKKSLDDLDKYERFDYTYLRDHFQPAADFLTTHPDKKLYHGEFGTIRHCPLLYRENWMRDVIGLTKEHGISYCVWNYLSTPYDGNNFSLVDDDNREIVSKTMLKIIRGEL
jgi:hypothetical protein